MPLKRPSWSKFPKTMAYHCFLYVYFNKFPAVVDSKRVPNKFRRNMTISRPCFDRNFLSTCLLFFDFLKQFLVYIRTFFQRSCHMFTMKKGRSEEHTSELQ